MESLGLFYDHLVYFTAIGNILWPFGVFSGHLVYFSPFWYFLPRKIWQPCSTMSINAYLIVGKVVSKIEDLLPNKPAA
jgi:hypothetical protein